MKWIEMVSEYIFDVPDPKSLFWKIYIIIWILQRIYSIVDVEKKLESMKVLPEKSNHFCFPEYRKLDLNKSLCELVSVSQKSLIKFRKKLIIFLFTPTSYWKAKNSRKQNRVVEKWIRFFWVQCMIKFKRKRWK